MEIRGSSQSTFPAVVAPCCRVESGELGERVAAGVDRVGLVGAEEVAPVGDHVVHDHECSARRFVDAGVVGPRCSHVGGRKKVAIDVSFGPEGLGTAVAEVCFHAVGAGPSAPVGRLDHDGDALLVGKGV